MSLTVVSPGLLTTVQDGGRFGHASIGAGASGAMDTVALRLANILVGNAENAAALEITLRGPRLRCDVDCLIALTGAPVEARSDASVMPMWRPLSLRAGTELEFGSIHSGSRSYVAVAGGVQTASLLGSRSVDVNAGIGRALAAGALLPITASALRESVKWSLDPLPWFDATSVDPIRLIAGAHFAQLDAASQRALLAAEFRIGTDSNRVGYRLEGAKLALREPLEMVSAGVVPGTVQLPPGGTPIVLMAEAPTVGGYPRIAYLAEVDLPRLAQRRPGERVRFTQVSPEAAQTLYLERERAISALAQTVRERLHERH
jgi:antagonist of KipI